MSDKPELSDAAKAFINSLADKCGFELEVHYGKCIESPECPYCHGHLTEPYTIEIVVDDDEPFTVEGYRCMRCETIFAENVRLKR